CPRVLRQDCARWVDEIQRATPTLVVRAVGADGCDIVDAKVVLDGAVIAQRLEGTPLPTDPGVHVLRVEPPSGAPLEQRLVVVEGDQGRRVELRAGPPGATCGAARAEPPPRERSQAEERPTPPLVYVLGGVGLAMIAGGSGVALHGFAQR